MSYRIFFSYPRIADERGAVSDIRAHIAREVMLKTGEADVRVFQDRAGLLGGDTWREALETSDWCRKELHLYLEFGKQSGRTRNVVPLLWEDTTTRHARNAEQLATLDLVNSYQAVPWQKLRHENSGYQGYRAALSAFADAIAEKLLPG